jgi:methionyl-tRNA formyltransferase
MNIVFFGTPPYVIPIIETLSKNFNLICVVTAPDAPAGRKKILTPTPVKQWTKKNLISTIVLTPQQYDNAVIEQLSTLHPDLFIVAAYGTLIPQKVLTVPKLGAINIHPSLLPKYRGPSPIQTAILNGDKETGVTIIKMDEELDHGPIIAQKKITLKGNETSQSLHERLFQMAAAMLPSIIRQLTNKTIVPIPQDDTKATYCKKITKQDGYFDISNPPSPEKLDRMIRAYYPWPTAYTKLGIQNEKIKLVRFLPERKIQVEGGKVMTIRDFLNGYPKLKEILNRLI